MILFFIQTALMLLFVFLQSTILNGIFFGVTPDISMLILINCAHRAGAFRAQTSGFVAGIIEDIISLSPLGFHSFVKTVLGNLFGLTKGKIFLDSILLQMLFAIIATIIKIFIMFVLGSIFTPEISAINFGRPMLLEIGINAVLSPLVFFLLKLTGVIEKKTKELL